MEHPIFTLEQETMERWRKGDPMGWAEISAEDVTYVDPFLTKPIVGLEEYTAFLKGLIGQIHYEYSEFIDPKVVVVGDAAVLSYNYRSKAETTSTSENLWNVTQVYFCRDGQWKNVHSHWSFVQHQLPALVEVPVPVQTGDQEYTGVLGELMALESGAMERWSAGDPWGFIELSAPDVTYFDTRTPQRINGREALSAEYATLEGKIFYDVMDFVDPRAQVHGDMAVLNYRFLSTWLKPDRAVLRRTPWNCTEVFARIDGAWKIVHTHWSFIKGERR